MAEGHPQDTVRNTAYVALLVLSALVALLLRTWRLADVPLGVDYDEAGNYILAGEIASGQSTPVFIRAYAGREAVFYWLAAASMRLLGHELFAFRLAAALCGTGTVLLTYPLAREMFHDVPSLERRWVPLLSTALIAVSYSHIHVSRYGFRVNAMPLFIAAAMTLLWRGLRRGSWIELALAGVLCGLAGNTYLAVRAFPLVLLLFAGWVILTWEPVRAPSDSPATSGAEPRVGRWQRVVQLAVFGLAALVALAPLGVFFVRNPAYFGIRMGQASVFDPAIHGGDLWGTLWDVTVKALGMFTVRGDADPIYNIPGKPLYGPLLGIVFYVGLAACAYSAVRAATHRQRTPYLLILVWLPVMLIPNILGARGVPHALRSMGLVPVVYYVPALGLAAGLRGVEWLVNRARDRATARAVASWSGVLIAAAVLIAGGLQTSAQYFGQWAHSAGAYYNGSASLRRAAEYLGEQNPDEMALWVSNSTYRHTTYAATCANYAQLRWFSGPTLVLPLGTDRPVLYVFDFTNRLDPVLARYLPEDTLLHRDLGPDGRAGFEAYLVPPERLPDPEPQVPVRTNLGNTIEFLGYDVNSPGVSGDALDVTFYWRALRDGDREDYAFFAHLVDDLGFRWGEQTFFDYPSIQWHEGDVMLYHVRIPIEHGAPPGEYELHLGVFSSSLNARLPVLDEGGQMAGTAVRVVPVDVARAPSTPDELPPIGRPQEVQFGEALRLLGADRDRGDLRPGETLALTLYWLATGALDDVSQVSIWLESASGQAIPLWQGDPAHGTYPFVQWRPPEYVRDRYALRLPTDVPAGDYDLRLSVLRPDGTPLPTIGGADAASLYTVHVHATNRLWEPPPGIRPVGARLGDVVELVGYVLEQEDAVPGETIGLTLVWRAVREMDTAYTVFTHLLDEGGQVRGQKDNPPVGGRYSTRLWVPGEVVVDEYQIPIDTGAPPGTYAIEVGMYDPVDVERLPVLDPSGSTGDRVLLGPIRVR